MIRRLLAAPVLWVWLILPAAALDAEEKAARAARRAASRTPRVD